MTGPSQADSKVAKQRVAFVAGLVALLCGVVVACGTPTGGAGDPEWDALCPPPDFPIEGAVDVAARCRSVLAVADDRLGLLHWPVSSAKVRWNICPPNARCVEFVQLSQAWVVYRFWFGDPVMIHVKPPTGGDLMGGEFVADAPEPVPAWLLDELQPEPARL